MHNTLALLPYGLALLGAGLACGLINTLASSGSAISLPVLMMLGLSPLAANATNRLPVLFGSLMALHTFQRKHEVNWRVGMMVAVPATVGSVAGVLLAEKLPRRDMALVITAAVLVALLLLFTKLRQVLQRPSDRLAHITVMGVIALLAVGFWLGFIVLDGATYLLLVLILIFRFDLVRANALKVLLLVTTTLVPIAMFSSAGKIHWTEGLLMSAGSIAGGYLGARFTMHERAKFWIFRILVAVLVLEIVHLSIQYAASYVGYRNAPGI
ncbi:MAG: sulfite exporter TauE/SafE family protein [Acidobacteriaceae bacterium]|nr:sulfite exporter TauE/SafE family protein [Acidobacteriaceae bacterium]MBV9225289.1 sulfite exporter TauE/SafE family protein [Acidobacteriaceae bacterium]